MGRNASSSPGPDIERTVRCQNTVILQPKPRSEDNFTVWCQSTGFRSLVTTDRQRWHRKNCCHVFKIAGGCRNTLLKHRERVSFSQLWTTEVRVLPTGTLYNHRIRPLTLRTNLQEEHCWDTITSSEDDSPVFRIRHCSGLQARHQNTCGICIIQSLSTRKCQRRITTMWSELRHRNRKSNWCNCIKDETHHDSTLNMLKDIVFRGWPNLRKQCPQELWDYWNFRCDLVIDDGLVLKGDRIVIPQSLKKEILEAIQVIKAKPNVFS